MNKIIILTKPAKKNTLDRFSSDALTGHARRISIRVLMRSSISEVAALMLFKKFSYMQHTYSYKFRGSLITYSFHVQLKWGIGVGPQIQLTLKLYWSVTVFCVQRLLLLKHLETFLPNMISCEQEARCSEGRGRRHSYQILASSVDPNLGLALVLENDNQTCRWGTSEIVKLPSERQLFTLICWQKERRRE